MLLRVSLINQLINHLLINCLIAAMESDFLAATEHADWMTDNGNS
jgi:hypothetical protein